MSIIYIGYGKDTLHEQPGSTWSKNEVGLDQLEEIYAGPHSAKQNWLDTKPLGSTHPDYPSMYLVSRPDHDTRSYSYVNATWIGKKDPDQDTVAQISRRTAIKSATFSTDSPEPASKDLTYRSPEIVFSYASDSEVLSAQQNPSQALPSFSLDIIRSVILTDEGKRYTGNAPAGLVSALTSAPLWLLTNLDSQEIKYTPFWANQEVWSYEYTQT